MGLWKFLAGPSRQMMASLTLAVVSVAALCADDAPTLDVETMMADHNLAGFSYAVVDNYQIVETGAYGVRQAGQPARVDGHTAFSAASISKAITGMIAAMLAEKGQIDLDAPVSGYLKRWQLPQSAYTRETPITLRHLLTHTAGTSQSGFADFFPGDDIPTLVESLNGEKLERYKKPIEVMWQPGSRFKYSGGGFVIAQVAIEDVTGKSLADLAAELIFEPLGMADSTMHQNGHPRFLQNVSSAHNDDLSLVGAGGVPIYPQTAASGLWTTPTDMAKLVIDIQKALADGGGRVISRAVAREVTRVQTLLKAGGWGLGWMRFEKFGNLDWFSHSGFNSGIGGLVVATMEDGRAIALFGSGTPRVRLPVMDAVMKHVMESRQWRTDLPEKAGPRAAVKDRLVGYYRNINTGYFSPFNTVVRIFETDGVLMIDNSLGAQAARALVHMGGGTFRVSGFRGKAFGAYRKGGKEYLAFYHPDVVGAGIALEKMAEGDIPPHEVARSKGFEAGLKAYRAWQEGDPNSALLGVRAFKRLARAAVDGGRNDEALTFYRIGAHYFPEDEAFQSGMASLQGD
ncbi:MAG: beta-lactamase family protein [Alphaproteobacteria bacterium]|nr:beta-lactamase family protein [Alphaproteobacteria bacterium]